MPVKVFTEDNYICLVTTLNNQTKTLMIGFFSKLFGKKARTELSPEIKEQQRRKWEGFDFFQKGKEYFLNTQTEDALCCFDSAFENGFTEYFSIDAIQLYEMRGYCLQELHFDYDAIADFDNSIALSQNDCNLYFLRSLSKAAILDFKGEIVDLERAIELSKIDNASNREYNDELRKRGYPSGATPMFEMHLIRARMNLQTDIEDTQRIENALTPKDKLFWEEMYNVKIAKRLSRIKKR